MNNKKIIIIIMSIMFFGLIIAGSTYAWWTWISSNEQNTSVTFTITNGTNQLKAILEANTTVINDLAPSKGCSGTNAKKIDVTTYYQNESVGKAAVNATLKLTSLTSSNTAGIDRSKINYAITTESGSSCANLNNIIASGNLGGKANGDAIYTGDLAVGTILPGTSMTSRTIYLYFWIDASYAYNNSGNSVVNDPMQNMTIKVEWSGTISNDMSTLPTYAYSAYYSPTNFFHIGDTIPSDMILFTTPQAAMYAAKAIGNGISETPYCLKHKIENGVITESYIVFAITDAMHNLTSKLVPGIYELKGGDDGASFEDNKTILESAFGENTCTPTTDRTQDNIEGESCFSNGLYAFAYEDGYVGVNLNNEVNCIVYYDANAVCKINS